MDNFYLFFLVPPTQNVGMPGALVAILQPRSKGQKNWRNIISLSHKNKGNNYLSWLLFMQENETISVQPHYSQDPDVDSQLEFLSDTTFV